MKQKLRSGYDPAACAVIKKTISLLEEDYQDCSSKIALLQLQIEALLSRQRQLKLYETKLQSRLSPFPTEKVPNEVLMLVFNFASQDNLLREHRGLKDSPLWPNGEDGLVAKPAMALSSVCSRWHSLGLSYPAIWSRMSLIVDLETNIAPAEGFYNTVNLYIQRSGNSLLRLRIHAMRGFNPHPVLNLVGQYTHRWQLLKFIGDALYPCGAVFGIPGKVHNFPELDTIDFDYINEVGIGFFCRTPKLKTFTTDTLLHLLLVPQSTFPWQQLTFLEFVFADGVDTIADFCPNLVSLQIHLDVYIPTECSPRIEFGNVQSLSVIAHRQSNVADCVETILSSLGCPSLTSLTLERRETFEDDAGPEGRFLRYFESFLVESSCTLTSLLFRGFHLSEYFLPSIFWRLPSLTSLAIEDPHLVLKSSITITSSLIQSLHISKPTAYCSYLTPPLLPKLRHLSLAYSGEVFNDKAFVNMILSRCLSDARLFRISPLQSLVLNFRHRPLTSLLAEAYEPLSTLEEAGFKLVIKVNVFGFVCYFERCAYCHLVPHYFTVTPLRRGEEWDGAGQ